jgi:hypothetical protein
MKLTHDQIEAMQRGEPVTIPSPELGSDIVLLRREEFERLRQAVEPNEQNSLAHDAPTELAPGVRRAKEAFLRDLPNLLPDRRFARRWALYHLEQRRFMAATKEEAVREALRLNLPDDEIYFARVSSHGEGPVEVDPSLFEFDEASSSASES